MSELSQVLIDLIAGLTDEQQQAVLASASGKMRISAGAGSGKTEVLTRRIAALLEQGIRPDEIVAITYTTKAAAEMKARLVDKRRIHPSKLREMEVATFHSFISRFLRQDPFGAGLDRSDAVIAENNRQLVIAELVDSFAEKFGDRIIEGPEALGAAVAMKLVREFPGALSRIRRYLLKPAEFYGLAREIFKSRPASATELEKRTLEWLFRFYVCYLEELERRGFLDFDEILLRGRNRLKICDSLASCRRGAYFSSMNFRTTTPISSISSRPSAATATAISVSSAMKSRASTAFRVPISTLFATLRATTM